MSTEPSLHAENHQTHAPRLPGSDWGSASRHGDNEPASWGLFCCKQISSDGSVASAHSWEMWRWDLWPVWSLIKDGSWQSRSDGSVLCTSCHELLAAFCFSPHIPVALSLPLLLPTCHSLCSWSGVWPYPWVWRVQEKLNFEEMM